MQTTLHRYDTAEALFIAALHAIHDARDAGLIDAALAESRTDWLRQRFGSVGVDRQIAACRAMLLLCRRHELTYADVVAIVGRP